MSQQSGVLGFLVGGMIRRSVRTRFRRVYWRKREQLLTSPTILYANHHGWMDGYLMFHLVMRLGLNCVDWIEEFDTFPLFAMVGGLRFSKGDILGRASTIRKTIRLMNDHGRSLVIFPEQQLHRPPDLLPFGRVLETMARHVPGVELVPVAIRYELSIHERPEAWISTGSKHSFGGLLDCQDRLTRQLVDLRAEIARDEPFDVLADGTPDVNERWNMRRLPTG
ncbi:MAG: 1-acyl-sn-glycerol-3-phosphate acyltransferase [Fimbriimonas sp.]|nr:1-acyl-sn-glycerol-3-phosphate acyltransferase [Fimbriimonas sp.]